MEYYIPLYARKRSARLHRFYSIRNAVAPFVKAVAAVATVLVTVQAAAQIVEVLFG